MAATGLLARRIDRADKSPELLAADKGCHGVAVVRTLVVEQDTAGSHDDVRHESCRLNQRQALLWERRRLRLLGDDQIEPFIGGLDLLGELPMRDVWRVVVFVQSVGGSVGQTVASERESVRFEQVASRIYMLHPRHPPEADAPFTWEISTYSADQQGALPFCRCRSLLFRPDVAPFCDNILRFVLPAVAIGATIGQQSETDGSR